MYFQPIHRSKVPTTDICSIEKMANDLLMKGSILIGAGVGLCILLRVLTGVKSPQYSRVLCVLLLNSYLCYNRAEKCSIKI